MHDVKILPANKLGRDFIPARFLPEGEDEYYLRYQQNAKPPDHWRRLRPDEIDTLRSGGNTCDDWELVLVADPFVPHLVRDCQFAGLVRIGRLERLILEHHDLQVPVGISNSAIIACDLGDNVAIHDVRYLAHFIIGDHVLLRDIGEMNTTDHAKFGNGILKDGELEDVRVRMDLMNEAGGRSVMPFDGMIPADAYLWAKYRDDGRLMERLGEITQAQFDSRRGVYGTIGDECVIKNCRILKDVKIGPCCYIKGCNKLKNVTVNSSREEPSQIGEGVELVNGIIGFGCHVFYGCKAVRFVMGNNAKLKYGARLIHSFLGDNSTVSCCEILNNLVFPAHEQHHNNSFLVASLLLGQSNIAAGATVGSNHNSRANDGEIQAGRGFWPGLCATLKHPSRFASFVLLAKGNYAAELDVPLPFSLVSNDGARDRLLVMPAYWWLYNMYALARNSWKFQTRDHRETKTQKIEFETLAPDTVEEIFRAMELLEVWTAKAQLRETGGPIADAGSGLAALGRELLLGAEDRTRSIEILGEKIENTRRKVVVLKARPAYHAYREMLHFYAVKNLLHFLKTRPNATLEAMVAELAGDRVCDWVNMGGQLMPATEVQRLREDINTGRLNQWCEIHDRYRDLWEEYPRQKQRHAFAALLALLDLKHLTKEAWEASLGEFLRIHEYVRDQVYATRKRDFDDPFRRITFRDRAEMDAVLGSPDGNSFFRQVCEETDAMRRFVDAIAGQGCQFGGAKPREAR